MYHATNVKGQGGGALGVKDRLVLSKDQEVVAPGVIVPDDGAGVLANAVKVVLVVVVWQARLKQPAPDHRVFVGLGVQDKVVVLVTGVLDGLQDGRVNLRLLQLGLGEFLGFHALHRRIRVKVALEIAGVRKQER